MNFTKILGWVLLLAGVLIIVWTLYSSYNIFTAKAAIPEIFSSSAESYGGSAVASGEGGEMGMQAQMEKMIGEQLQGLIPADTIPKMLNLAVWAMLAGILIFGGAQISNLGIKLIKK
jgi:hypothetical protein